MNNLADDPVQADRIKKLTAMMKDQLKQTGDNVDLDKPDWGVPFIPSWQEREKASKKKA